MFSSTTFKIYRLTTVTENKKSYQDTGSVIAGQLEPVDIEFAQLSGSGFGKSFKFFSKDVSASIKEADRFISGSDEYDVKGVQSYDHPPRHLELILEKVIRQ